MNDDQEYALAMLKVWAQELKQFIDAYDIKRGDIPSLKLLRVQKEIEAVDELLTNKG